MADRSDVTISEIYRKFVLYFGLSAPLTRRYWHAISQTNAAGTAFQRSSTESAGLLTDAYSNNFNKDVDEYRLQKQRARQTIQKLRVSNRRAVSFDVVSPNLAIYSKEYSEKKANPRHRSIRILPPSDIRLSQILPVDLNSTILTGHQIVNPAKDSSSRGVGKLSADCKDSSVGVVKSNRTLSLGSNNSIEQHYLQQQSQQLQLQQRQHLQSQRSSAKDYIEEPSINGATKCQMPVLSKKLQTRSGILSMSSSMPSIKVNAKAAVVEPCYMDPMVNCPLGFHQRIAEINLLESDTIRWEKSKKAKKKPRDNS